MMRLIALAIALSVMPTLHAADKPAAGRKPSSQVSPEEGAKTLQRLFECAREFRAASGTMTEDALFRCAEPLFSRSLSEGQRRRLVAAVPLFMAPGEPGSCDSVPGASERFRGLPAIPETRELCFHFELWNRDKKIGLATFTQESGSAAILRLIY